MPAGAPIRSARYLSKKGATIMKANLVFEDGTVFEGKVFAGSGERFGEVVFNTAMTGYQEVLTDPSYAGQMVLMTYPLIGNYGINSEDCESRSIFLETFIVKEYLDCPSNWRSEKSLKDYLNEHNILGVEGFDTRAITRFIRENGAQKAAITTLDEPIEKTLEKVRASQGMQGKNLVEKVTCEEKYDWDKPQKTKVKIAVIDCGIKYNILRMMTEEGCECTVYPATVSADEILDKNYDGVFVSNGPGDPEPVKNVIETLKQLIGKLPIFGICLGNQLLGIALGGRACKLKFGHHGVNHPVKNIKTDQVEITSQNHGFCLDMESLDKDIIEVTHINLNDNTVEGFKHRTLPVFCVQYHPEAAPGPHDSRYLFKDFLSLIENINTGGQA
jgi:carbamoyl-phosphate synthase small subunit